MLLKNFGIVLTIIVLFQAHLENAVQLPANCSEPTWPHQEVDCEGVIPDFNSYEHLEHDHYQVQKFKVGNCENFVLSSETSRRLQPFDLKTFEIDCNETEVEEGSLDSQVNLTEISIRKQVSAFPKHFFCAFSSLKVLRVSRNNLSSESDFGLLTECSASPHPVSCGANIWRLVAARCQLSSIEKEGFLCNLRALEELTLPENAIESIENGSFAATPKLSKLNFRGNLISELSLGIFHQLSNLKELILDSNRLRVLPAGIFQNLQRLFHLSISNNQLSNIDGLFQNLTKLTRLDLNGNRIERIDASTFQGLPQLQFLNLSTNSIEQISPAAFDQLSQMNYLYLDHNRLKQFSISSSLKVLQTLNLGHNLIDEISHADLKEETGLSFLYLNNNNLSSISSDLFSSMKNLKRIDLANNKITHLENDTFDGIDHLGRLDLAGNKLSFQRYQFPFTLRNLNLSRNELTDLKHLGLAAFSHLDLSSNKIRSISMKIFEGFTTSSTLHLENNRLTNFPIWSINCTPSLPLIGLAHNPWTCNCGFVKPFVQYINKHVSKFLDVDQLTCVSHNSSLTYAIVPSSPFNSTVMCVNEAHDHEVMFALWGTFLVPVVLIVLACIRWRNIIKSTSRKLGRSLSRSSRT